MSEPEIEARPKRGRISIFGRDAALRRHRPRSADGTRVTGRLFSCNRCAATPRRRTAQRAVPTSQKLRCARANSHRGKGLDRGEQNAMLCAGVYAFPFSPGLPAQINRMQPRAGRCAEDGPGAILRVAAAGVVGSRSPDAGRFRHGPTVGHLDHRERHRLGARRFNQSRLELHSDAGL